MPIPCFIANWKMYKTIAQAADYLHAFEKEFQPPPQDAWEAIIAPPYTSLSAVSEILKRVPLPIHLAAQNLYFEEQGAYTGEISPRMLREVCRYVIIGHSERRSLFGETNLEIKKKIRAALKEGLVPILCIGETAEARREGKTWRVIEQQLSEALDRDLGDLSGMLIAYEPVWAIGTGITPHPSEAEAVHFQIGNYLSQAGRSARILYGGSVNDKNIEGFMKEPHINGVLAGGSSLSPEVFAKMIQLGSAAKISE